MGTRPDISYSVSRFQEKPTEKSFRHLKRIQRYLQETVNLKIWYKPGKDSQPIVKFVDLDYASDLLDRKSTSGFIIFVHDCPVLWVSRKQPVVAFSLTEAEFVVANYAVCEVAWLRKILTDLHIKLLF